MLWKMLTTGGTADFKGAYQRVGTKEVQKTVFDAVYVGFEHMITAYVGECVPEVKKVTKDFVDSVKRLVDQSEKQFKEIKTMKTKPAFAYAKAAGRELACAFQEACNSAEDLLDKVKTDT